MCFILKLLNKFLCVLVCYFNYNFCNFMVKINIITLTETFTIRNRDARACC